MGSTQSTKWCCRVDCRVEAKDANVQCEIKPNKLCEQMNDRVVQSSIEFHWFSYEIKELMGFWGMLCILGFHGLLTAPHVV